MTSSEDVDATLSMILSPACTPSERKIELPLPPKDLMPNRANGKHWASVSSLKKSYREECWFMTKYQAKDYEEQPKRLKVDLVYMLPDGRHRDADNLLAASKAGLDGMAQALGVDDKVFEPITVHRIYKSKTPKLIVRLEKL